MLFKWEYLNAKRNLQFKKKSFFSDILMKKVELKGFCYFMNAKGLEDEAKIYKNADFS